MTGTTSKGSLNLLQGLTIDKAYFDSSFGELVIKTKCGKTITVNCHCPDSYFDEEVNVRLEDSDSTVLLDINA